MSFFHNEYLPPYTPVIFIESDEIATLVTGLEEVHDQTGSFSASPSLKEKMTISMKANAANFLTKLKLYSMANW